MTDTTAPDISQLDVATLKELARVICGDDDLYYRSGRDISEFLTRAGWEHVPAYQGQYRREWTVELLIERRHLPGQLEKVLLRLAEPLEYLDEPEQLAAVVTAVNAFLIHEGLRIVTPGGRPRIITCDPALAGPGHHSPAEFRGTLADIITDPRAAQVLQSRMDEAQTCYENGAHVAAIIMLGSILEGVLLRAVLERDPSLLGNAKVDKISLAELIKRCHTAGWIDADIEKFCHELREYRNYVHPRQEIDATHTPDRDTLNVSWQVVGAVLNDLHASRPQPTS
ncbi:hypothetical protein F7Q99_21625 [Streptomyces kaniharaensis]|uniref:DUF4145 domain-containing protein n=1 Tax=Streptomyces kaniharaensis TaxID=212423 RepID=A0A6N7KTD7_9ACTN|nr:hypothetical protein [Streptomyces kaniharaensis]MQS14790.1 hypothetical protein [Streptomyces kaniharaensis]